MWPYCEEPECFPLWFVALFCDAYSGVWPLTEDSGQDILPFRAAVTAGRVIQLQGASWAVWGGTSVRRKKSISDPDQLRLCVTCVCLGGVGGALTVTSLECGRHQIISSHSERWRTAENLICPEITQRHFHKSKAPESSELAWCVNRARTNR